MTPEELKELLEYLRENEGTPNEDKSKFSDMNMMMQVSKQAPKKDPVENIETKLPPLAINPWYRQYFNLLKNRGALGHIMSNNPLNTRTNNPSVASNKEGGY
jgi:hypothetical protein